MNFKTMNLFELKLFKIKFMHINYQNPKELTNQFCNCVY